MSAVWRRAGQLLTQGVPFRDAIVQARVELEPGYAGIRILPPPLSGVVVRNRVIDWRWAAAEDVTPP